LTEKDRGQALYDVAEFSGASSRRYREKRKKEQTGYGIAPVLTQINEKSRQTWLAGNYD
jgi:hypothetical protein